MKRKFFSILVALVLLLTLGLVTAAPVGAAALTVDTGLADTPPNYWTIQAAITAATAGDTITVAAGTYDERLTIDKQLTLTGAGVTSIVRPTAAPALNYDVQITSAAGGTIIQGFTFDFNDTGTRGGYGIWVDAADVEIRDNTIELGEGVGASVTGQGVGITARINQTVDGLIIDGNDFVGTTAAVISTDGGLGIWLEGTATALSPITVSNNDFSGPLYAAVGVATNNVDILDNELTGEDATVGEGFGIGLGVAQDGLTLDNVTIDGNTIDTFGTAIDVLATGTDTSVVATITDNTIIDSGEGVYADGNAATPSTLTVNYNDITGNTDGVINDGDFTIDAGNNWWGVTLPTEVLGEVTGVVVYTPWLSAPIAEAYVSVTENPELDSDFYGVPGTVAVTVYHWVSNADPMALDEITIAAESDTDNAPGDEEVTLQEEGADTGIFKGTVTLIAAPPADREADEIVAEEGDTITVTYSGETAEAVVDETVPVFTSVVSDAADYKNTDIVILTVTLDVAGYTVTADFSALDSEYTAEDETVTDDGAGVYTVTYTIAEANTTADGEHAIPVAAEDDAGNPAADSCSVALDNTAPAVADPAADPVVIQPDTATDVTFTASVSDAGSGVDTVTVDLFSIGGSATQAMLDDGASGDGAADDGVYGHIETDVTVTAEDTYGLTVTATDLLGNDDATVDIALSVIDDLDDPVIESTAVEYPVGYESVRPGESVIITAVATDALSGLETVTVDAEDIGLGATEALTEVAGTYSATLVVGAGTAADTYTLTVTATDYAGNEATADVVLEVTLVLTGYNIDLAVGWNLISLPLIPDEPDIAVVLADITVDAVYSYDANTKTWSSYAPGVPSDLATMNDGKAYWVEMSAAATLSIVGNELPDPPATPPVYSVVEGWNFIGFKSTTPAIADDYLAAIADQYTVIYGFDATSQIYVTVDSAVDSFAPGMGFWIAVTEPGNIYP